MEDQHPCAICGQPASNFAGRYPNAVCPNCWQKTTDESGRAVEFFNQSMSGGIKANYKDSKEPYTKTADGFGYECYIEGKKCIAQEAHMGGIVVQPTE